MDKKKVLMIDDDHDFSKLVKVNLEEMGNYEVRVENNGEAGVSAVMAFKPDIILLDVVLGDIDGSNVAKQIKETEDGKSTPIVYVTAIIKPEDEKNMHNFLGGYPFIAKPVTTEKLIAAIEENLNK